MKERKPTPEEIAHHKAQREAIERIKAWEVLGVTTRQERRAMERALQKLRRRQ